VSSDSLHFSRVQGRLTADWGGENVLAKRVTCNEGGSMEGCPLCPDRLRPCQYRVSEDTVGIPGTASNCRTLDAA
jgi:hypothetical protein